MMCLLAQDYVFEEGETLLKELLGIEMSAKQVQRVSEWTGKELEHQIQEYADPFSKLKAPVLKLSQPDEVVYAMFDGSMVFTREEGWKEIKVGRVFNESSSVGIQKNRRQIFQSQYVCHLGKHKDFLEKWESYIDEYPHKVFIADGAKWIWNHVCDAYPDSLQILDFFHAAEKIGDYAAIQYSDPDERKMWLETQKGRLLNNEVAGVIQTLKTEKGRNNKANEARKDAIGYYENNRNRMQYKTYLDKGYLIGSGPIESAHRNVIQQRLKLSGQRWSIKGAQQIANLRACRKSNQWNVVINLIKAAA
jgi:hypothetical protein